MLGPVGTSPVKPCGGFFCQQVPINQAGEQIIFRQDGDRVTAVVLIQYVGEAEDFSWVVPVIGIPELSTGSDLVFAPLEFASRPQFILEQTGELCEPFFPPPGLPTNDAAGDGGGGGGEIDGDEVDVLQELSVGPFDVQIVASDDPDALATWLEENNYNLSDRGRDLIAPYVEEGLNFVALRLRQDQGVGDIQPLILHYESGEPCVPIRLTAVAAQPDMGVLVWMLGPSRAYPTNYLHVVPNYTRLNWFSGSFSAYASYQGLITAAMNEAGGQGFATDYAGPSDGFIDQIPTVSSYEDELVRLSAIDNDAEFVRQLAGGFLFPADHVLEILHRALPLPEGEGDFIYQVPELLTMTFDANQLVSARMSIVNEINEGIIQPLEETLALFDGNPYMTRLYTTLSPEEMTLDPLFGFNPDLEDQDFVRFATIDLQCDLLGRQRWSLTLGEGTGREGERVIEGTGLPPFVLGTPITVDQGDVWRTEAVFSNGSPLVMEQKQFPIAQVIGPNGFGFGGSGDSRLCGRGMTGMCGAGGVAAMLMTLIGLRSLRRR